MAQVAARQAELHRRETENVVQFPAFEPSPSPAPSEKEPTPYYGQSSTTMRHVSPPRERTKSFSEQTQEAVKHLAPPISIPLVVLCLSWYMTSALSNTVAKSILNRFEYPVTLTMIQFLYAVLFSVLMSAAAKRLPTIADAFPANTISPEGMQGPCEFVLRSTGPMAGFQLVGHILSYSAMSEIPVSMLHAIKSLSPLFTVGAYTLLLGTSYNRSTYIALIPLTVGVIMTCSAQFRARPLAIVFALFSTLVFVSQNIYSKGLLTYGTMPGHASTKKLDKLTILCWCAAFAFLGTLPIWLVTDGWKMATSGVSIGGSGFDLLVLFTLNGASHFCQNMLSFLVLGSISPVSYSIASLLKRIVVITFAIVYFGQHVTPQQGWGIAITFVGLYIYDRFGSKARPRSSPLPQ